ncbi:MULTISPECIES: cation transporter [Clostridium]|uniref:cation transporter n=1 Tax=Clostridium TaxID=1485 RepID=UPI00069CBEDD|nr:MULTISPECIES: heavy-metal-associated domain-containing protein [Clostridium]KOF57439.1 ferredoxin [Clostridium sp. DMHC 10]MCD2348377.1 heavy-metal-associated domain-containing protein [Clostridium guangxiense]
MKSVLRVGNICSVNDVNKVRNVVSQNEGVVACYINKENKIVEIIYDNYLLKLDDIIESIESLGYFIE